MNVFEINNALSQVWEMVLDEDADLDVLEDTIQALEVARDEKAEGMAKLIRYLDSQADVIKAEEKRLADRRKALENRKDRVKQLLEMQFQLWGTDKIKTATMTVSMQNNPPSVQIADENLVPDEFVTIETIRKIDKKSLLQRLKDGETFDGISIHQGRSLRIR
jgi:hypothetical protein